MTPGDGPARRGILLTRDLIFTSKVTGTAQALGCSVLAVGSPAKAVEAIGDESTGVVFLDLSAGPDLVGPEAIRRYRDVGRGVTLIAFGSHVDEAALRAAAEAGCDLVLPRSRFSAGLPELIQRHLGPTPTPEAP